MAYIWRQLQLTQLHFQTKNIRNTKIAEIPYMSVNTENDF